MQECRPQSPTAGWSPLNSATAVAGPPARPVMAPAPARGHNAIDPAWRPLPAHGSPIVRYKLQVWNPAASMWDTVRNDLPSTPASDKRSMLTAGTKYVYRLRAVNRAADNKCLGNWSTIKFEDTAQ